MNMDNVLKAVRSMAAAKGNISDDVAKSCIGGLTPEELYLIEEALVISLREKDVSIHVMVEETMKQELGRRSAMSNITLSDYVRNIFNDHIEQKGQTLL